MMLARRACSVVCVAVTAVAGCSGSSGGKDGRPSPSLASSVARKIYLDTVRPLLPASNSDQDLINLGHALCAALSSTHDYASLVANETSGGFLTPDQVGKLLASAVVTLCPGNLTYMPGGANGP